jgi:ubiquitin-like domain-containing CTD phosphatase 1
MNPQSGVKIQAFKNAPLTRATDVELFHLTKYLLQLTIVEDFTAMDHAVYVADKGVEEV